MICSFSSDSSSKWISSLKHTHFQSLVVYEFSLLLKKLFCLTLIWEDNQFFWQTMHLWYSWFCIYALIVWKSTCFFSTRSVFAAIAAHDKALYWIIKIWSHHFCIQEHSHHLNKMHVEDCSNKFDFDQSK